MTTMPIAPRLAALQPVRARLVGGWRTLPAVATVLLLSVPAAQDTDITETTHVTAADAASAVLVAGCAFALLRDRRP
jgi:hypothetical protein